MRALPGIAVIGACCVLASCAWMFTGLGPMNPPCEEKLFREYPSANGSRKAIELHSTCEANQYVATIEVADRNGSGRATAMHASFHQRQQSPVWPELKVDWKSENELWVTYPAGVDAQCISSPPGVTVHCVDGTIAR